MVVPQMGRELLDKRQASTSGAKEHFCECPFLSGCAATGNARLNLEARALAAVSGIKVERRGGGEPYLERSGRRSVAERRGAEGRGPTGSL